MQGGINTVFFAGFRVRQYARCLRRMRERSKKNRRPPGKTRPELFLISAAAAENGFAMLCTMPMFSNAWTAGLGRKFRVFARCAARECHTSRHIAENAALCSGMEVKGMMNQTETARLENMRQYGFGPEMMKRLKVCRYCGAICGTEKKFCGQCNASLPDETLFHLYKSRHTVCPACETVVPDTAYFCPQCGDKIHRKNK